MISAFFKEAGANFIKVPVLKIDHLFIDHVNDDPKAFQIYLTNEGHGKKVILNPQKAGYYVDIGKSNAIEFSRGGFYPYSDKILHRARLYTVFDYYDDNGNLIEKDLDFKEWVNIIYKLFKKAFLKKTNVNKDFLFSENAIKWMLENEARVDTAGLKAYA